MDMARGATSSLPTTTTVLLLLTIFVWSGGGTSRHRRLHHQPNPDDVDWSQLRQVVTRNVSGVRLEEPRAIGGSILEIVEEQTCSSTLVRLTCRSLEAFVFVLEAEYQPERSDACRLRGGYVNRENLCKLRRRLANARLLQMRRDYLTYRYGFEQPEQPLDFRSSINRRCSGLQHCRYRVLSDHPEALFWKPANIRIKYACIPEVSVYKYCNTVIKVPGGAGGFLKSPGYPLYYLGGITCEWTFRSHPNQRVLLTFHDFSIRDHDRDGSCVDIVRIRDSGDTLFQSCGTMAGVKVVSNTNVVTVKIMAEMMLYPARGFFLQYQALSSAAAASEEGQRQHLHHHRQIVSSADSEPSLGVQGGAGAGAFVHRPSQVQTTQTDRSTLHGLLDEMANAAPDRHGIVNVSTAGHGIMDPAKIDDGDYVVDVILPSLLIALLFLGNAVIVYVIFQYRKRKAPMEVREEVALSALSNGDPQV